MKSSERQSSSALKSSEALEEKEEEVGARDWRPGHLTGDFGVGGVPTEEPVLFMDTNQARTLQPEAPDFKAPSIVYILMMKLQER